MSCSSHDRKHPLEREEGKERERERGGGGEGGGGGIIGREEKKEGRDKKKME